MSELIGAHSLPLRNVEIILTRAEHQLEASAQHFEAHGASVIRAPTICIKEPPPPKSPFYKRGTWLIPKEDLGGMLWRFDWLIFTSVNAVKYADRAWQSFGGLKAALNLRPQTVAMHRIRWARVACIGESTLKALQHLDVRVDLIPKHFHAEGLVAAFDSEIVENKRILIPRALVARELVPEALRMRGAEVWICPLYQTVSNLISTEIKRRMIAPLDQDQKRAIVFTSDSTLNRLLEQLTAPEIDCIKRLCAVFVIGPAIKRSVLREGFKVSGMAEPHTMQGLFQVIIDYFRKEES